MFNLSNESKETITIDSFEISEVGIILELQHFEHGIAKNTELVSNTSGLAWRVKARLLYDHAVASQRIFPGETNDFIMIGFESAELIQESIDRIKDKESRNIFRYILEPVGHDAIPEIGDKMSIIKPKNKVRNLLSSS